MIEKSIISNLILDEQYFRKTIPFIKDEYFHDQTHKATFRLIDQYVKKYSKQPSTQALLIDLEETTLSQDEVKNVKEFVDNLDGEPIKDKEWLLDQTEKFCQDKAVYNAIMNSIQILDGKGDKGKGAIPQILSDALAVSFDTHIGHDFLEDYEQRYDFYHRKEEKVPFDLDYFNKITKGGLARKTLNIALAGTGVGKSLFMCHCAASNLTKGLNVLYITLEMAEEKIAERIDANLLNVTIDELSMLPRDAYQKKIDRVRGKTAGKLIIKEYPTSSAGSANFRHLLNELKVKKGFLPDIIYIDYLNICMSSRFKHGSNINSYTYVKAIAEELRGLAGEFNVPIVSATQTTRSGFCLDLESEVLTKNGIKKIKDVNVGDELLSINGFNTVKKVYPIESNQVYSIRTKSGKQIICSGKHKFPVGENLTEKSIYDGLKVGEKLKIYK